MTWRPISEAPRDGTVIWACETGHQIGLPMPYQYMAAWEAHERFAAGGFWYSLADTTISAPTHWQPLPPPPEVEP
jgi:hypothetical protein